MTAFKVVLIATLAVTVALAQLPSMDLKLPLTSSGPGPWKSFGSTIFSTTQAILTTQRAQPNVPQRGALWNQNPFPFKDQWEITFRFKISGRLNDGEGMALWLTENPNELGPIFGSRDMFRGLAIVFDSKDNDKLRNNPSISAHYFDGTQPYDHEDDGLRTQLAGCIADYRNRNNVVAAKIAHNGTHISVHVDLTETGEFRRCLVEPLKLRDAPVYLGVSAETTDGAVQETQDVIGIEVKSLRPRASVPAYGSDSEQKKVPIPEPAAPVSFQVPPASAPASAYQAPPVYQAPPSPPAYQAPPQAPAAAAPRPVEFDVSPILEKIDRLTKSVNFEIPSVARQVDAVNKLVQAVKGSIDAGRVENERRFNELEVKVVQQAAELQTIKQTLERTTRNTMSTIDRKIRDNSSMVNQALQKGNNSWGFWLFIALFQSMFVAFLMFRHISNNKFDKLL